MSALVKALVSAKGSALVHPICGDNLPGSGPQIETRWFRKNRLLSGYKFPVTEIVGDFEMTFDATLPIPSSSGGYIFATNELVEDRFLIDNDRVVRDDLGLDAVGTMSGGSIPQSLYIANLLYNFKISRIGNNIEFKINNIFTAYAERLSANDSFFLDSFLMKWGGTTAVEEWVGYFANVKLWAGNSETGILIRAHAIDDPNAAYQINEATGVADLLTINGVPSDWTEAYKDVSDPQNPVWRKVSDDAILLEYAA
jgi:hypothetical protein